MKNLQSFTSLTFPQSGAYYTIERIGQEPPASGNGVVVTAVLHLPCGAIGNTLLERLQFRCKVILMGENLASDWGHFHEPTNTRATSSDFTAISWGEAFSKARKHIEREMWGLEEALLVRAKALVDAEKD